MDQWLDSLSEDWVSQPRSPHSSSILQETLSKDAPSPGNNSSQSRIPRYKPRSISGPVKANVNQTGRLASTRRSSQVDGALREKTSSKVNASQKLNAQTKGQSPNTRAQGVHGRKTTDSIAELEQGTVQYKSSPKKEQKLHGTPEWKRRVLKENTGGDLFAPIGLESVFKPPTISVKTQEQPAGKRQLLRRENVPSSPPSAPPRAKDKSKASAKPVNALSNIVSSPVETGFNPDPVEDVQDVSLPYSSRKRPDSSNTSRPASTTPAKNRDSDPPGSPLSSPSRSEPLPSHSNVPRVSSKALDHSEVFSDKSRNENISPFYVSKQGTIDGQVEYAAVDMSMQRLRSQMDNMRLQQQNVPNSRSSDSGIAHAESRGFESSVLRGQMSEFTSQSLPDDLSMGTDAYAISGAFVTLRRGGYSNDGSFQRAPVSPSLLPDLDGPSLRIESSTENGEVTSPKLPRNFSQTKSRTPSSPQPSSIPQTPKNCNHGGSGSDGRPRSSGSPLKLFDKYDTFTNERLIRRMSKFEETPNPGPQDDSAADSSNALPSSPSPRRRRLYNQTSTDPIEEAARGRRISSFGYGELDHHSFPPYKATDTARQDIDHNENDRIPSKSFRFNRAASNDDGDNGRAGNTTRKKLNSVDHSGLDQEDDRGNSKPQGSDVDGSESKRFQNQRRTANGKRLPDSPAKNPTTKRRRTLLTSGTVTAGIDEDPEKHKLPGQSVSGRKRKDALYDSDRQAADPTTLAMRQIRQPRVPVSGQSGESTKPSKACSTTHIVNTVPSEPTLLDGKDNSMVDPPTQIVAGALATIALNTAQEVAYGSRKASVTTADFFNEAQQIMQLIRAKGRPRSSHATTEGSEVGQPTIVEESYAEESTKDQFSRPPSREGNPHRLEKPARLDARAVSHLRKFEDDQDLGLALSSSLKTLKISQSRRQSQVSGVDHDKSNPMNSDTESDPPNIRIRENDVQNQKRKHSSTTSLSLLESEHRKGSQNTDASGPSSGRSNPTGSSQSSTNRMVIAPETVAHLLSDQMAGMVFDRQRQLWVKRKSSPNVECINQQDQSTSHVSEDDLFAEIPDLSVDEMEELQRVKDAVSSVKSMGSQADKISVRDQAVFGETEGNASDHDEQVNDVRPRTAEDKSIPTVEDSSAPSKFSHFASSALQPGTRATSWGNENYSNKGSQLPRNPIQLDLKSVGNEDEEQVEHEISIFEGREIRTPKYQCQKKYQARVVTVAFSSPLVEPRREPDPQEHDTSDSGEEESDLSLNDSPVKYGSRQETSPKKCISSVSAQRLGTRNASRHMSFNNQSYQARPMSRLDEEDEMSIVQYSLGNQQVSMDVAITTPLPVSRSLMLPPSTNGRSSVCFNLSPLPDFTVHQIDKAIDGSGVKIAKRLPTRSADNRLSLAAQDLVSKLTDLEPYEPYWDYLRFIDLHNRNLGTLHMLAEFCGRAEELDVSNNQIRELNGIPHTVRQLNIRGNSLSDLAAWDPLQNLQYLDVSNNKLSSLQGFQNLFHLRSLKADGNDIKNISGLEDLNGLTSLSLRENRLRAVDFETFDL